MGGWVSARRPPHACPGGGGWVSGARKRRRIVDHGELDARLRARRCSGAAILTSLTRQAHMRGAMQSAMQSACGRLTCADGISDRKCSASERRRDRRRVGGWGRRRPCSGSGGVVGSAKPTPLLALSSEALRKGAEAGPLWHRDEGGSGCTLPPPDRLGRSTPPPTRPAEAASAVQLKIYDL